MVHRRPHVLGKELTERKNILFVQTVSDLYGAERSLLEVADRLGPIWRPHFLVPGPGRLMAALQEREHPIDVLPLTRGGSSEVSRETLLSLVRVAHVIRSRRIDLAHLNLHFPAPLVASACRLAGVPLVVHVRNMADDDPTWLYRHLFRCARGYICISRAVATRLVETRLLSPRQAADAWVIPDGRDLSVYSRGNRERVRNEFGATNETPLVGIVARIEPMKGQDIFLQAAALVMRQIPEARFLVVGGITDDRCREYVQQLHTICRELKLEDHVIFTGYREDTPDVLAGLDCFLHPSRRGAFVSVLIEAMASALPIVASDVDGIPECVGRKGAADLVYPLEPPGFAEAVVKILTDSRRAKKMGMLGRERCRELYDIGRLARQTEAVFEFCL